jgi:hypothetical protein
VHRLLSDAARTLTPAKSDRHSPLPLPLPLPLLLPLPLPLVLVSVLVTETVASFHRVSASGSAWIRPSS